MKTLIIHNIISSNSVFKLNSYIRKNKEELGDVKVLFCSKTEKNRRWKLREKIEFKHEILPRLSISFGRKDLFSYFINWNIFKKLSQFSPDRIIVSGWDQFAYQTSVLWGFLKKRRVTIWSGSTDYESSWRRFITIPFVKLLVRLANDYIAYGTRAKEYLIKLGAKEGKIELFLNDVNKEYFKAESKRWRKKRKSTKRHYGLRKKYNFIFVGQLISRKGIIDLLQAYKNIKDRLSNWGLVIVGDGYLQDEIREFVNKSELGDVHLLGYIEQYKLPRLYAACDVLVLPSREEVWGLVVNEALHCDLKVVVGDRCGCVSDLVKPGKNGYIYPSGSVQQLSKKLLDISFLVER